MQFFFSLPLAAIGRAYMLLGRLGSVISVGWPCAQPKVKGSLVENEEDRYWDIVNNLYSNISLFLFSLYLLSFL